MNYHIMIDDKFIDGFIEDAEKVSKEGSNIYFVRGKKENSVHVKHPKCNWINLNDLNFINTLKSLTSQDKIIVHWYDLEIGELLLKELDTQVPLYVALWGGEFYEDPYLYNIDWIHDSKTLKFVKKENIVAEKYKTRPHLFFKKMWLIINYKKKSSIEFERKRQTIKRINKLLLPIHDDAEVELIKKIFDLDKLDYSFFNYDLNVDFSSILALKNESISNDKKLIIQLGNSATESNNHVDAFYIIKKFAKQNIELFLPLSYGNKKYSLFVKKFGNKIFPDKIEYVESFLPRNIYIEKLQKTNICIMFHNRQQAFGNCIPLLMLGKKVYIKDNNPLYSLFKSIGITIFDANKIEGMTFEEFSAPLSEEEIKRNCDIIMNNFSQEKRLEYLGKILN